MKSIGSDGSVLLHRISGSTAGISPRRFVDSDSIGLLTIGNFQEEFAASLFEWGKEDYESQWRHAIRTIITGGDRAALIVHYASPSTSNNLEWWPMYALEGTVFFQDHFLFYEQLTKPFSAENAFLSLRDRRTMNEDGHDLSEWSLPSTEIEEFAKSFLL